MKEVAFGNQTVIVNEAKTNELYDWLTSGFGLDICQCDGCSNARMTRVRFMPRDQYDLLNSLGLNPQIPVHCQWVRSYTKESRQFTRRMSKWYLYASFDRPEPAQKLMFENKGVAWIDDSESTDEIKHRTINWPNLDLEGLVVIRTSNSYPWLYGQVTSLKTSRFATCEECGSGFREIGFLKKNSLIPEWYGLPELRKVLLIGKSRVRVYLCSHCGHLDYEVTKR